jgi:2-(1,2-epoxy-1,2-dihydrophenyl)acetyl-CoA isomerase
VRQPPRVGAPTVLISRRSLIHTLKSAVADGVATITLNRPQSLNSLNLATKEALLGALADVSRDDMVRCVVLTGSGRAFCVGQDLKEHDRLLNDDPAEVFTSVDKHYNPIATALLEMPKPVIAAVNGVAAGAGASLALACDIRLAAESASFNLAFSAVGLSCDTGASWTLPRLMGRAKALELLYFSETLTSAQALEWGLVNRVVPDDELSVEVDALAARLASGPTLAYAAIKACVDFSATNSIRQSLSFERNQIAATAASLDHRRAVRAFLAKEQPVFDGR